MICLDDRWGQILAGQLEDKCITYGVESGHWRVRTLSPGLEQRFQLTNAEGDTLDLSLPLPGRHNLQNATAAVLLALEMGLSAEEVARRLSFVPAVPGRMEPVSTSGKGPTVLIDYAHSPDGYRCLFEAIAEIPRARTHIVFGLRW